MVSNLMKMCLQFMLKNLIPENMQDTSQLYIKDTNLKVVPIFWYCLDFSTKRIANIIFIQKHNLNLIRCRTRESLFEP